MARHYPIANETFNKPMIPPIKPAPRVAAIPQENPWPKSLALVILGALFAAAGAIF